MVSLAEATGTVLPNSVNIRKQPDQESEVIGSSTVGKEISIRGKVDVSGITWYQVYIDANNMGYVRADMIEKKGDGDIPTVTLASESQQSQTSEGGEADSQEPAASGSSGGGAQVDAQEAMDLQYASTKVQAKVRPDPSTSNNPVDSLTPGTQVVVSGKSEGSDSKTWYYVTFTASNGSEKTGYIRSDLLELGEMLPMEEEPAPVVQTPPPPVDPETKALNLEVNAPAPVQEEPAAQEEDAGPPAAVAAFAPAPERPQIPQSDPFAEDEPPAADLEATRVLNLEELQFGRNYVKD